MIAAPRTGRQHALAVLQALFVSFLWSTSWVLIKIGLDDLDLKPLSFAGLRYALAALILLPFGIRAMRSAHAAAPLNGRLIGRVALTVCSSFPWRRAHSSRRSPFCRRPRSA